MPSPICEVKDGAGAYVATTDGVDVTASNVITIRLADSTGVTAWGLTCVDTDDTLVAATINASLVIDQLTKTATYTEPAGLGTAITFQSVVQEGNRDGAVYAPYTTRFQVHCLTAESLRVMSSNETTESSASFGWIVKMNTKIRQAAGGGSFNPIAIATSLIFAAATVAPTITQTITGVATGQPLRIAAQEAATTGGKLTLASGVGGTTNGDLDLASGAATRLRISPAGDINWFDGAGTWSRWDQWAAAGQCSETYTSAVTSVLHTQAGTAAASGAPWTIQSQAGGVAGGSLNLSSGTGPSAATAGYVNIQTGGVNRLQVGYNFVYCSVAIVASDLDRLAAGNLRLGDVVATGVNISRVGMPTAIAGSLSVAQAAALTTTLTVGTSVAIGASPSTATGSSVKLSNNESITSRTNAAANANIAVMDSGNNITFGDGSFTTFVYGSVLYIGGINTNSWYMSNGSSTIAGYVGAGKQFEIQYSSGTVGTMKLGYAVQGMGDATGNPFRFSRASRTHADSYTQTAADAAHLIYVRTGSPGSDQTVTMPTAADQVRFLRNDFGDASLLKVTPATGALSTGIAALNGAWIECDGTNWSLMSAASTK